MREFLLATILSLFCYFLGSANLQAICWLIAILFVVATVWGGLIFSILALEKQSSVLVSWLPAKVRVAGRTLQVHIVIASGFVLLAVLLGLFFGIGYVAGQR